MDQLKITHSAKKLRKQKNLEVPILTISATDSGANERFLTENKMSAYYTIFEKV